MTSATSPQPRPERPSGPSTPPAGSEPHPTPASAAPPAKQAATPSTGKATPSTGKSGSRSSSKSRGKRNSSESRRRRPRLTRVEETSAGGLVLRVDDDGAQVALIGRLDRRRRLVWSMPKGHLEEGETAEQAAEREVAEETGITAHVVAPLGDIDFWFVADGRRIHKTVHHFLLRATGGELSDEDVEVEEVAWVPLEELPTRLGYADERRLLHRVPALIVESGLTVEDEVLAALDVRRPPEASGADSA